MDPKHPESKYPNKWSKVVLLGDSLTQFAFEQEGNWGGRLQGLLKRKADVLNRGFSGYNSELLKLVLPRLFDGEFYKQVACLTLCIGANDSWNPTSTKFNPGLPLEKYRANLVEIIEFLLKSGLSKDRLLLITPPTIVCSKFAEFCKQEQIEITKTPEQTRKYVDAMIEIGKQFDVKVFDMFELTSLEEHVEKAFIDGLHYSKYGADLLFDLISGDVDQLVAKHRQTARENFATYLDADYNHPETFYTAEPAPIKSP